MRLPWHVRPRLAAAACALAAGCSLGGGGDGSTPIGNVNATPEVLACRARVDEPFRFAEIAIRDARNLGGKRVSDRTGTERRARLHPDGNRVVFARERSAGVASSRDLFLSTLDGSFVELRLTSNQTIDDEPCWSPDGTRILFSGERDGVRALRTMRIDGSEEQVLLSPPAGFADGEPDWNAGSQRIVWSRGDLDGHHRLWLANADGTGSLPLTDGGAASGPGTGDFAPAFAPAGDRIVFVRRSSTGATLCFCDAATGVVEVRLTTAGAIDTPRFAPPMDRVLFGLAEPTAGRSALRLAMLPIAGDTPTLLWPDERWQLTGLDLMPAFPGLPGELAAPRTLDIEKATVELAAGGLIWGVRSDLAAADGAELRVGTTSFEVREIAGINCIFDLPVQDPEDVVELRIRAVARVDRIGGDSVLRMSIHNPVDGRFDTAVELTPTGTGAQTMTFSSASLRHLTREKQLRVTVIADLPHGDDANLDVDLVEVVMVSTPQPPQ